MGRGRSLCRIGKKKDQWIKGRESAREERRSFIPAAPSEARPQDLDTI